MWLKTLSVMGSGLKIKKAALKSFVKIFAASELYMIGSKPDIIE
jgi:hypothetical protein